MKEKFIKITIFFIFASFALSAQASADSVNLVKRLEVLEQLLINQQQKIDKQDEQIKELSADRHETDSIINSNKEIIAKTDSVVKANKFTDFFKSNAKFKISGYFQGQFQWGMPHAKLKVGSANLNDEMSFNRMGIRRGRIKMQFGLNIFNAVFQIDLTEKGVGIKDAYAQIYDPWLKQNYITAGVFNRQFGHEIIYSSSKRESPERAMIITTLFPDERDLGAAISLKAGGKDSKWNMLRLDAMVASGNGPNKDIDNFKDFMGHLYVKHTYKNIDFGGGFSYYYGGVYQDTAVYSMVGNEYVLNYDVNNIGKFAKREYFGFDAQFGIKSIIGTTKLSAEFVFGQQPGGHETSVSPCTSVQLKRNIYVRPFQGGYAMLVQSLGKLPVSVVFKYDWYDPNTSLAGNEIGLTNYSGRADIGHQTFGFGLLYDVTKNFRIMAYYDLKYNELSANLKDYEADRKDDMFTLRLQYKF